MIARLRSAFRRWFAEHYFQDLLMESYDAGYRVGQYAVDTARAKAAFGPPNPKRRFTIVADSEREAVRYLIASCRAGAPVNRDKTA